MANYFGPNSAAWTARSGVVLDPEKNGPMSFNGAPNMNMIMSQAIILDHASQQATAGNPKMKMQLQSGSDLTGPTISSQSIPGLMNGHPTMPAQSGNNVIPQSYGGSMQSMGMVSSGMNPHMMLNAPQSVLNMNMMASNLPGMNLSGMNVTGQAMQGINSMARTMTPGLGTSTVGSMGVNMTRLPIMNANIPPSMFMQTVNFDSSLNQEDMNRTMESSMDLIEQQQAIEQSKLLHRFKELRQLQIQQQEMLMKQQQEQLESLRSEQQNIHSVMAKQRKNQWGGQVVNRDPGSQTRTPPQRQRPPGAALAKSMTMTQQSQQSFTEQANQSSLPCPVMYVPLNEDNDEIKTNPDLFSDTNSHAGSQSTEEAFHQLPDSASEIGELPQIPNKKPVSRVHVSGFHSSMKKSLTDELEQDEGIGTQSFKASGQTDYQTYRSSSPIEMDDDNDHQEDTQLEEQDLDQDDEDEDFDEEDEEKVTSDNGSDDQPIKSRALDDRPLAGIGEKKTFEELLEEQLKAEEDKMKSAALQGQNQDSPKRSFLKRGQGIARFGLQDKSKPIKDLKSIKPKVDSNSAQQIKSSKSDSQLDKPTKGDNAGKQQNKKGDNSTKQPKNIGKDEGPGAKKRGTWQQRSALNLKTSPAKNLKLKKSPNNKDDKVIGKGQKTSDLHEQKLLPNKQIIKESNKPPIKEEPQNGRQPIENVRGNINAQQKTGIREATQSPDSFPDDASFVAKIDERIRYEEVEKEDLDEFELLENCADNMSFCSQSSFVTRIFQKDKLRQETFKPPTQSPRQSVAMQLQATIKNATQQQQSLQTNLQGEYLSIPEENEPSSPQKQITSQRQLKDQDQVCEDSSEEEDEESEEEEDEDESEEDSSDETESEEDSDEYETDEEPQKSPTKIMTRKVASQNTVSNLLQKLKINQQNDSVASLNASTFVPNPKSPIVISKELTTANKPTSIQDESLDEADFKIHSQISSLRKSTESTSDGNNDSDDSENSYSNLKIIPKNVPKSNNDLDSKSTTDSDEKLRTESDDKHSSDFDDEEEWGDTTLKARSPSEKHKSSNEDTNEGTPPTSKLVAKLFPKLKPQPSKQQKEDQQKLQTINNTVFSDGVQSKVLRDKLAELEKEIEKFRSENINLDKLRKEREEGIQRLKKEISEFEREKSLELSRIQEYRNEEMKKIKHEKKMFEKYQKAARDIPNKKEREEIEVLKNQMTELQEEMKRKETRWTSSNSRLRSKIEQLEQENSELKEEIKLMEKRRLEWLQKEQNKVKSAVTSSTPTQPLPTQNSADFQTTDSDEEKDPVRDSSSSKTSNSQMSLRSTQSSTQVRTVGLPPSQPTQTVPAKTAPSSKNINEGPTKGAQPSLSNQQGLPKTVQPSFTNPGPSRTAQPSYTSHPGPSKPTQPNSISSQSKPPDHILRMSLMEDVPRGGAVTAVPQDTSLYTDTECDITNNGNVPRKTASKYSVDRSMIDKGNSGYDEFQHSDGKIERVYKTGAREILFPNGTRKEISADGKSIVVSFFNGDIKQIMPDQRVVYYYAEAQTTHSNYPDGLEVLQFPNNQVEKHYPDGTKEITFADQTIKYLFPNGSEESIFPDGTVIRVDKNGDKTMEFPNGQREIHTNEYKKREYPDGTVKTVYPDGRQETRYSNGRIRVKDRDGNVIVDRRC